MRRRARASRPSAARVSSTSKKGRPATGGVPRRTTAAVAPPAPACPRKSWASYFSPLRATKRVPGVRCLVSVEMALNVSFAGAGTPRAAATSSLVQVRPAVSPSSHSVPSQAADHVPLVERLLDGADDLIGLVPLAREQDGVALARQLERLADRGAAIHDPIVRASPPP